MSWAITIGLIIAGVVAGLVWALASKIIFQKIKDYLRNQYGRNTQAGLGDLFGSLLGVLLCSAVLFAIINVAIFVMDLNLELKDGMNTFWKGIAGGALLFYFAFNSNRR